MQVLFLSFFPLLVLLSMSQIESRFDVVVEVRSTAGFTLPAEVWVTLDGLDNGQHSTIVLSGQRTVRFPALVPGSYRVKVEAEGYPPSQVELSARASKGDEYLIVDLGPPESDEEILDAPGVVHYQALQLSPLAQAHWEEAGKALTENRLNSALKSLEQVIGMEPEFASAHCAVGTVSMELQKWDRAERAFLKATQLAPSDNRYHLGLGWFYLKTDRLDRALAPLKKAAELRPEDAEAHAFLGEALRLTGNFEQSVIHLEKAVALNPKLRLALHSLALTYLDLNDTERALQSFRTLLQKGAVPATQLKKVKKLVLKLEQRTDKGKEGQR